MASGTSTSGRKSNESPLSKPAKAKVAAVEQQAPSTVQVVATPAPQPASFPASMIAAKHQAPSTVQVVAKPKRKMRLHYAGGYARGLHGLGDASAAMLKVVAENARTDYPADYLEYALQAVQGYLAGVAERERNEATKAAGDA